jgi:MOSC domain-containing protein YiiM
MGDLWRERILQIGVVRPGDTLVLAADQSITVKEAADIQAQLEQLIPDVQVIVMSGMTATIVSRAEDS